MHGDDDRPLPADDAPTIAAGARPDPPPASGVVAEIGGFRILGKLGEGGMGIVYEAEQQNPRRRVALKVIRGGHHVDELSLRMFEREAESLARLAHPNIAAIYEAGRTGDGMHFFTMELIEGRNLSAYVKERLGGGAPSPAQLRERLGLFATICRAVNYAHQRGVVHRDLKPSNVIVTDSGVAKILDFGLARITDTDAAAGTVATETGLLKGTLGYMSPEQARGDTRDIDLRTDVYTLGVILYEMLAGRPPYETSGKSLVSAIQAICEESPRPLEATPGGTAIAADLRTLLGKALEKEPDRRYQSAGALADDVERFLANQPILAHPPSTMYQLRKLVSRHKARVAAVGAIGVMALALLASTLVQSRRVELERDRATAEAKKSTAINTFLLDALGAADPWARGSRSVLLVDALRQAQSKAHASFAGEPLIEASVLRTIGTTFAGLADFAAADSALRASLALCEAGEGGRGDDAANTLVALSDLNLRWQRYPEAEQNAREALAIADSIHGPKSLEGLPASVNLASTLGMLGKIPEGRAMAQRILAVARDHHASGGPDVVRGIDVPLAETTALSVLSQLAMIEGDTQSQFDFARQRLEIARAKQRDEPANLAQAMNDLASAQMSLGQLGAADTTYEEAIALARTSLGADHPIVATYLENQGGIYFKQGQLDRTARNLEVVLDMRRRAMGDDSEPVGRTYTNMGAVYRRLGDLDRAKECYLAGVSRLTRAVGRDHPDAAQAMLGLGKVLQMRREFAASEAALLPALAVFSKTLGEQHALTQGTLQTLAQLYTDWKRPEQAAKFAARVTPAK